MYRMGLKSNRIGLPNVTKWQVFEGIHVMLTRFHFLPRHPFRGLAAYLALSVTLVHSPVVTGQDRSASDLLPETVTVYAELAPLQDVLALVLNHPFREKLEALPSYATLLESEGYQRFRDGIAAFEGSMGKPWDEAIATVTDRGVVFAYDPHSQGLVLLIHSSDDDQLKRLRGFVLAIAQMGQGNFGPVQQGEYRGFTGYVVRENLKMALVDDWMVLTNQTDLGKGIIDRYLDASGNSFSDNEQYQMAMDDANSTSANLNVFVDLQSIRDRGVAEEAFYAGKTENIVVETLLGGVLSNLTQTPVVTASLSIAETGATLTARTPHDRSYESGREYYFGSPELAMAPPLLADEQRLFALSTTRDLSQMWLRSGDLMTDKANDDLAQADTQLTTFFSGRDFGEDILGSLRPEIQFVAARQSFDDRHPVPAIKLPMFAFQFQMRTPEKTTAEFRRVFQSFIGFLNVVGAMQGQPQFDLGSLQSGDAMLYTATYVPEPEQAESEKAPINFNFSPTLAFQGSSNGSGQFDGVGQTFNRS